jgi:hypothetical protein
LIHYEVGERGDIAMLPSLPSAEEIGARMIPPNHLLACLKWGRSLEKKRTSGSQILDFFGLLQIDGRGRETTNLLSSTQTSEVRSTPRHPYISPTPLHEGHAGGCVRVAKCVPVELHTERKGKGIYISTSLDKLASAFR